MFIVCLLYVHDMHTVCLCMIIVCLLYVYCMFLYDYRMFIIVCILYVCCVFTLCSWYAYCLFMYDYHMFTLCFKKDPTSYSLRSSTEQTHFPVEDRLTVGAASVDISLSLPPKQTEIV